MSRDRGRSSELLLRIDRRRGAVVGSLQSSLRDAIRAGRLRDGDALPASRTLADELGISRASVVEAYARLAAEGFVTTSPGSATRVAPGTTGPVEAAVAAPASEAPTYDLRPGGPDVQLFPWDAWARAASRLLRGDDVAQLHYADPRGTERLRTALAPYLARTRAVVASPDDVIVTGGVTQGLTMLCRVLHRRGDRVLAVEDPGPNPVERAAIRHAGLEPLPIPTDRDGIDVAALAESGARAVLVTPAHHYPTGGVMSADRRRALVGWARSERRLVIEDDYDAEFRYDQLAVASLQGLAPRRVAYLGSTSKLIAPGLRLGWIVPPAWLAPAIADEKQFDDFGSPTIEQLVLAELIENGTLGRHVRRARSAYRRRRDATLAALGRHLPDWTADGVAAGLQVLVRPPGPIDERAVVVAAYREGIWVGGLASFREPGTVGPPGLVIGFAMVPEAAIDSSIAALARIIRGSTDTEKAPS